MQVYIWPWSKNIFYAGVEHRVSSALFASLSYTNRSSIPLRCTALERRKKYMGSLHIIGDSIEDVYDTLSWKNLRSTRCAPKSSLLLSPTVYVVKKTFINVESVSIRMRIHVSIRKVYYYFRHTQPPKTHNNINAREIWKSVHQKTRKQIHWHFPISICTHTTHAHTHTLIHTQHHCSFNA